MKPDKIVLRKEVLWFAEQMELRLRENEHKGGWKDCERWWLFGNALEELAEVHKEMNAELDPSESESAIVCECTDLANYVMMLADVTKEGQEGHH